MIHGEVCLLAGLSRLQFGSGQLDTWHIFACHLRLTVTLQPSAAACISISVAYLHVFSLWNYKHISLFFNIAHLNSLSARVLKVAYC